MGASAGKDPLNYDQAIILDAEALAEQGIRNAYRRVSERLVALGIEPKPISEEVVGLGSGLITRR